MDLYTPRFVKGSGSEKVGLCPICVEPISRGGEGTRMILKTKVSAYSKSSNYSLVDPTTHLPTLQIIIFSIIMVSFPDGTAA